MTSHPEHSAQPRWFALVNDRIIPMPRQHVPVAVIKAQAGLAADQALIRDHNSPRDAVLDDAATVDLAHGNVFYSRPRCDVTPQEAGGDPAKMAIAIDDRFELTLLAEQPLEALLGLFALPADTRLFRDYESPNDEHVAPKAILRFKDGPVFYTRGQAEKPVEITIDDKKYPVRPGKHSVAELKKIGGVAAADELVQIVNDKITPLPDDAEVCIVGSEVFVSHPRKGGSS